MGDAAATLILIVLKDTDLLEGLEDAAVDGAGGIDVVVGARAAVLGRAVDLAQTADTDGLTEVDVTSDGSGADVVPSGGQILPRLSWWWSHTSRRPGEGARWRPRS